MSEEAIKNTIVSLGIMGKGMLSIFTVIIILMLTVILLTWLTNIRKGNAE